MSGSTFGTSHRYELEAALTAADFSPVWASPFGGEFKWKPRVGWSSQHVVVRLIEPNRAGRWIAQFEVDAREVARTDVASVLSSIVEVLR